VSLDSAGTEQAVALGCVGPALEWAVLPGPGGRRRRRFRWSRSH